MTALIVSQALSWLVIAALVGVVLALTRQIGLLHERIAPVGALITDAGPGMGAILPRFSMRTPDGAPIGIGGPVATPGLRLLLFVAADCPICKRVAPLARTLSRAENFSLTLIGDGDPAPLRAMHTRLGLTDIPFALGADLGVHLHIGKLPTAVLLDETAAIRGKGLVNSREHLESLLVAHETGHDTLQAFLRTREVAHAD